MTDTDPRDQDTIREAIIDRIHSLGLRCSDVADRCGGEPGYHAISRYMQRQTSLNSRYVSILARSLGMRSIPLR